MLYFYRNAPFNKEELSSILKFGAEELFKDHDQEADQKLQVVYLEWGMQKWIKKRESKPFGNKKQYGVFQCF